MALQAWRKSLASLRETTQQLIQQQDFSDSDSEEVIMNMVQEEALTVPRRPRGGSRKGKARNIDRGRYEGAQRIVSDYFAPQSTYTSKTFHRRFKMGRELFLRIVSGIVEVDPTFQQSRDCCGVLGLSTLQKIIAGHRMLCYGYSADAVDEYVRIGESTTQQYLEKYCVAVIKKFGPQYLREPTKEDYKKQLEINARRGFPGMFGSLDCTHWIWKNCPTYLQGDFQNRKGTRSIILEAIATQDLWIWHHHFGIPGSNNDLNVIDRSPLLVKLMKGEGEKVEYTINGHEYHRSYLLADSIYPDYNILVKSISEPQDDMHKEFANNQESCRKDVERAFGVLKSKFHIIANPCRKWKAPMMKIMILACITMHNMIIEDEADRPGVSTRELCDDENEVDEEAREEEEQERDAEAWTFDDLKAYLNGIQNIETLCTLRNDLVQHQWERRGRRCTQQ